MGLKEMIEFETPLREFDSGWTPRSQALFPLFEKLINKYLSGETSQKTTQSNIPQCTCDFSFGNWSCTCGAGKREIESQKLTDSIGELPF